MLHMVSVLYFEDLENFGGGGSCVDINRGWESVRENVKASATECRLLLVDCPLFLLSDLFFISFVSNRSIRPS
jgi:hypothetical protein